MKITIDLSDLDVLALRHDLLDPEAWVRDAVRFKILACRERMAAAAIAALTADPKVKTMPADEDSLLDTLHKRTDYRDRAARQAEDDARSKHLIDAMTP